MFLSSTFNSELLFSPIPGEKKVLEGEEGEDDNEASMLLDISLNDNKEGQYIMSLCIDYITVGGYGLNKNNFNRCFDKEHNCDPLIAQLLEL